MANKVFGESRLSLSDGRELTLRFDFNALAEAEEAADKGTEDIMREMSKGRPRLNTARAMLYAAVRYHHRDITLEDAGDLLLTEDAKAISEAMGRAMEEMADRRSQNPRAGASVLMKPPPLRGTGTRSSKHGAKAA
jgi:hypothetical protein